MKIHLVLLLSTVILSYYENFCIYICDIEIANHGLLCECVCVQKCQGVHATMCVCLRVCVVLQNTCWAEDAFLHFKLIPKSASHRCEYPCLFKNKE